MSAPLAIYVRVSEVGEREGPGFGSPEEQESAARDWAERAGVEVYFNETECVDLDVSGATSASYRRLVKLIEGAKPESSAESSSAMSASGPRAHWWEPGARRVDFAKRTS